VVVSLARDLAAYRLRDPSPPFWGETNQIYTKFPFYGARKITLELREAGIRINRDGAAG